VHYSYKKILKAWSVIIKIKNYYYTGFGTIYRNFKEFKSNVFKIIEFPEECNKRKHTGT